MILLLRPIAAFKAVLSNIVCAVLPEISPKETQILSLTEPLGLRHEAGL